MKNIEKYLKKKLHLLVDLQKYCRRTSVKDAKEVLKSTIVTYEAYHDVEITDEACELAVDLSHQYMFNKKLPDKAFDIVDRACAYNRILRKERVKIIDVKEIRAEVLNLLKHTKSI